MLIVDVYNVLHVTGVLPPELAGLDPLGLADLIATSRYAKREALLICDGTRAALDRAHPGHAHHSPATLPPTIRLQFAGLAHTADDLIEAQLEITARSKRVIVVSSDHRLRKAAGRARARTLRSETFLHQLALDRASHQRGRPVAPGSRTPTRPAFATDIPLNRATLERWLAELTPSDLADLAAIEAAMSLQPPSPIAAPRPVPSPKPASAVPSLPSPANPTKSPARRTPPAAKPSTSTPLGPTPPRARPSMPPDLADWLLSHGIDPADLSMEQWLNLRPPPNPTELRPTHVEPGRRSGTPRAARKHR